MSRTSGSRVFLLSVVVLPLAIHVVGAEESADSLFRRTVLPMLKTKCFACHGDDARQLRGKFDVRSRAGLLAGGASRKPAVVPGEPEKSPLYQAVSWRSDELRMPPKENDRLSGEQIEAVRRWIAGGAPWPEDKPSGPASDAKDGVILATSGGLSPEWTNRKYRPDDVWAFRPVQRPTVPGPSGTHPIDAFVRDRQRKAGLTPTGPADRRTLIRRLTFDLTGLPPTLEELDAFVKDDAPDAHDRLVDRLLASKQHGEQMARHWLDVVRYADTSGFANDFERPTAWRYRDYVVRSFNRDKPFDRFIVEQIAGDELDADDPEMRIAVGFLRMGPWEHTGMSVAAVTRQQFLDDVTNAVGVTFLGQALRCASCHDHKFDPIPTRDYYRMQAVFATTQFADCDAAHLREENGAGFAEGRARTERLLKDARAVLAGFARKHDAAVAELLRQRGVKAVSELPAGERPNKHLGLSAQELSVQKVSEKRVRYFERELLRDQPLAFSVCNGPTVATPPNQARIVVPPPIRRTGPLQIVHILGGGSLEAPGDKVTPGVLSAVAGLRPIPETADGRRLALARWVASEQNSLTARVIVNRVWQWHFGRGLVATPNNLGKMGRRPTHPELLDWLATWFVEHGWSLKKLHRLIVISETYRQSGQHANPEAAARLDPNNELLSYFPPRRLEAEEIRDAMLAVSGELNPEAGGPGGFPEINWDVALQPRHIMGSVAPAYQPSPRPAQRNRRTLYAFRFRTLSDPALDVFDRPGSETSCPRRDETTVTPQVFALFNGQAAHDRALALACRIEKVADAAGMKVEQAFRLVYGRTPAADERAWCVEHLATMEAHHRDHPPVAAKLPARVKRQMVEELTGEPFTWEEELDGLKEYVRDRKPWDVGPGTRALADLCLVLLNSNEFLYVR